MHTIIDHVDRIAAQQPARPAIIEGETAIGYGEFARRLRRAAAALRQAGVEPGMRVGVALDDDRHHLVMLFAIAYMGAIVLPVDWRLPVADAAAQMARFGARILLTPRRRRQIDGIEVLHIDADWWGRADEMAPLDETPAVADRTFLIALSSGSTGAPDGRLMSHGNVMARLGEYLTCPGFATDSEFLSAAAISQASGRAYALYTLMLGNTLILYPSMFDVDEIVRELNRTKARQFFAVPTVIRWMLERATGPGPLLPHLRFFETTGAPLHEEEKLAARRLVSPGLVEIYASASTGNISRLTAAQFDTKAASVGQTVAGAEVEVVNDEGRPVESGERGHIRVRGPACALQPAIGDGHEDPAREESVRDGWIYPGEIGAFDDDGYLYLAGRVSEFILRNGVNVYPQEIEAVLQSHPDVQEAAVLGFDSAEHGEEVGAVVVPCNEVSIESLSAHCLERLASYKIPSRFETVDAFPRTLSGKIDKRRLRSLFGPGQ
jgi:acyl-CoA synthetase (AMP-forming)/AMP-acid ligase II